MKLFFRRIHLYLGLAAGVVIMITCMTGAILVFQEEIEHTVYKNRYEITQGDARQPLGELIASFREANPRAKIGGVKVYTDATRTIEVSYRIKTKEKEKPKEAASKTGAKPKGPENNLKAFIDPYTGRVVAQYDTKKSFFTKVLALHRYLLADDTGKLITGISTSIFLFIIITGFILWFPATMKLFRQRITIKKGANWKRINHDLHLMTGFYACIFLFIFAFTALAWSFKWFNDGIYKITNSPLKNPEPPLSIPFEGAKTVNIETALNTVPQQDALFYNINLPKGDSASFSISVLRTDAVHDVATDMYYVDQYTGKLNGQLTYNERSTGAKIRSSFKPIHTASIWGKPSKLIGFLACIIGMLLPITGIIMWINKAFKKKNGKA